MEAVKHVAAKGDVVAALKCICDWTAVNTVFCAAFKIRVENVHGIFAQVAVKAPIAIFGVVEIISE